MSNIHKSNKLYQKYSPILVSEFIQKSVRDEYQQIKSKRVSVNFSNILHTSLEALIIKVICLDTFSNLIGETLFDYFEMEIRPGDSFGENIFFEVPQKSTNYQAYVTKYKANGQIVDVKKSELVPYNSEYETPTLEFYKKYYFEKELEAEGKLVRDLYNDGNLIHCFCGETNHIDNKECYHCGITFEDDMVVDDNVIHAFMKKESETLLSKLQTKPDQYPINLKTIKEDALDNKIKSLKQDLEMIRESKYETIFTYIKEYLDFDLNSIIPSTIELVRNHKNKLINEEFMHKQKEIVSKLESLSLEDLFNILPSLEEKYIVNHEIYGLLNTMAKDFEYSREKKDKIKGASIFNQRNVLHKYFSVVQMTNYLEKLENIKNKNKHVEDLYEYLKKSIAAWRSLQGGWYSI